MTWKTGKETFDYKRVADYYNSDSEENRFDLPFKNIEKINTEYLLNEYISSGDRVLDCAAGTGVYFNAILNKGATITASDLSKRHVSVLKKRYPFIKIYCDNAIDLSRHKDNSFDVVICFGPIYHLPYHEAVVCIKECIKKVRTNGKVIIAYMCKHFVSFDLLFSKNYQTDFVDAISIAYEGKCPKKTGFFGCAFFYQPEEIEQMIHEAGAEIINHLTVDADIPHFFEKMEKFNTEQIEHIAKYIRSIGKRKTMLGSGKHNIIVIERK